MTNKEYKHTVFNSIAELGDHVANDKGAKQRYHASTDSHLCDMSPEEAIKIAQEGGYWPEGAKNIEPITLDVDVLNARDLSIVQPKLDICGYAPNVGAFLSNAPKNMRRQQPTTRPNRLMKVAIHIGKSFSIEQSETFNRGNAILSVCNALHELGLSLEIWAIHRNTSSTNQGYSNEIRIKDSFESYSPDSIAFALCNDAFQRRLSWRVAEMQQDNKLIKSALKSGYGNGRGADLSDFDLSFPFMTSERHWSRRDSALTKIIAMTKSQLHPEGVPA